METRDGERRSSSRSSATVWPISVQNLASPQSLEDLKEEEQEQASAAAQ